MGMLIEFVNLFFAGILAGLEVSAHYGFHAATLALGEKSQLILRQGVIRRLRWLVPAFFIPTTLSGFAVAIIDGAAPGFIFRLAALAAIVLWIFLRVVATVRINAATLDWDAEAPPANWQELVGKAERFHVVGTWAAVVTFFFFLIAMASRLHG